MHAPSPHLRCLDDFWLEALDLMRHVLQEKAHISPERVHDELEGLMARKLRVLRESRYPERDAGMAID